MKYLILGIILCCLNYCCVQKKYFLVYSKITGIKEDNKKCSKIFYDKNGELLYGKYKVKISKDFYKYAEYKNGHYINDVLYVRNKNIIWYKEKYDSDGKLLKYSHYQGKLKKEVLEDELNLYTLEKYDSVSTFFKAQLPIETIFYYGSIRKKVEYAIKPQKINITTNFDNFTIEPLDGSFNGISKHIFSMCDENIFLYNEINKEYFNQVKIIINQANQKTDTLNFYLHKNKRGFIYYDSYN